MKRVVIAIIALVCVVVAGCERKAAPSGKTSGNQGAKNLPQKSGEIPPPILWTVPGWYYGQWFDTPEEYDSWVNESYYDTYGKEETAAEQQRIEDRDTNQQDRIDDRQTDAQEYARGEESDWNEREDDRESDYDERGEDREGDRGGGGRR